MVYLQFFPGNLLGNLVGYSGLELAILDRNLQGILTGSAGAVILRFLLGNLSESLLGNLVGIVGVVYLQFFPGNLVGNDRRFFLGILLGNLEGKIGSDS